MTEPRPADAPAPGLHPIGSDPVDPAAAERAAVDAARAVPYAVWAPHAESVDLVLVDTEPGALHDAEDRWPVAAVVAMDPATGGWWTPTEDPLAALGLDAAQPPAAPSRGRTRAGPGRPGWSPIRPRPRAAASVAPSSTSCTWGPSRPRGPSTPPSPACLT
ncbi:hypothetical protein ACUXQY_000619 [Micrococcus aloeverae]